MTGVMQVDADGEVSYGYVRAPGNYNPDAVSFETGLRCEDPSKAIQSQADEADINVIVRRFGITGQLPSVAVPPTYADFTDGVTDYREAMDLILAANRSFMALPAEVRKRFDNDAALFLDFAENPANLDELRKMGLAIPRQEASDVNASGVGAGSGGSSSAGANGAPSG